MKKILLIIFIFFSLAVSAQEPSLLSLYQVGGNSVTEVATNVTTTNDGGFIIAYGTLATTGPIDSLCSQPDPTAIFQKYNADASVLEWTKCYQFNGDTGLGYMYPQNEGGTVFGGEYTSGYGWGFYICKQDELGNIVWSHGYSEGNGPLLQDMIATPDGGYMMIGDVYYTDTNFAVHNSGSMNADIGVIKLDSLGRKQWSEAIGGNENDEGAKAISIPGGGYYVFGGTLSNDYDCTGNHGAADAYLARLDSAGNILWHNDLGGSNYDGGGGADNGFACADGNGGIIMVTISASSDGEVNGHINPGTNNIWALDVDSSNHIVWNNCYGGGGGYWAGELPNSICKATDGSLWIAGESDAIGGEVDTAYGGESDAWFVHTDSVGNFLSAKVLGSSGQDNGFMVYPLSNGSVIVGGYYGDANGSFNMGWGSIAAFLATFSPWAEGIKQVQTNNDSIEIYPNPTTDQEVTIASALNLNYTVIITNVLWQIIYQTSFTGKTIIIVNGWQPGMYYVQVISENGFKTTKKLLVE